MCTFSLHFIFLWCFSHCKFQFWQNGKYNSKDPKIEDSKICLETNVDYDFLSAVFVTLNRRNHCRNYLLLLNFFIIRLAFLCCVCAVCCLLPIAVCWCLLMLINAPKWFSWICNRMYRHYTNIESVQTKTHTIKRWAMNKNCKEMDGTLGTIETFCSIPYRNGDRNFASDEIQLKVFRNIWLGWMDGLGSLWTWFTCTFCSGKRRFGKFWDIIASDKHSKKITLACETTPKVSQHSKSIWWIGCLLSRSLAVQCLTVKQS